MWETRGVGMNWSGMLCPLLHAQCSLPSSKAKGIKTELQVLCGKPIDHGQDDEAIVRLLEDLQEVVLHYQVCSSPTDLLDVDKGADGATNGNLRSRVKVDGE